MELKRIFGYLEHGLSIIPIIKGSKRPAINWKEYQERHPTSDEIRKWFTNRQFDVALVAGRVSGNLEIIDIDNHQGDADKIFWEWKEIVNNTIPNLFEKLLIQKITIGWLPYNLSRRLYHSWQHKTCQSQDRRQSRYFYRNSRWKGATL